MRMPSTTWATAIWALFWRSAMGRDPSLTSETVDDETRRSRRTIDYIKHKPSQDGVCEAVGRHLANERMYHELLLGNQPTSQCACFGQNKRYSSFCQLSS